MSTKEAIIEYIRSLPDDVTPEAAVEALALKLRIDEGLRQVAAGEVIDHEEFKKRMARWLA